MRDPGGRQPKRRVGRSQPGVGRASWQVRNGLGLVAIVNQNKHVL
jgi:hypothetical protein